VGGSPSGGALMTVGATSSVSATANAILISSNKAALVITCDGATNAAGTLISYSWANGNQGPLIFRNAAISNVMTLDAAGQVGIGVTPSYKFHSLVASGYSGAFKASTAAITGVLIGNTVADLTVGVDASGNGRITADASKYLGLGSGGLNDRVILDSAGNVGIFVTPSAWTSSVRAIDIVSGGLGVFSGGITHNAYFDNTDARWEYKGTGAATYYNLQTGIHQWFVAASGTANNPITTFATASMTLDASGNLLVGTTSLAGSSSNATAVILGSARTANGSVSTTTAVASTIFSITAALRGRYEVVALIANSGSPASYTSVASVIWDGNGGRVVANNGTNLTITLSGSDVQVTQTSGSAQTVFWSFLRVALA
jgi:hypothetical protein